MTKEALKQENWLTAIQGEFGRTPWVTLYRSTDEGDTHVAIFSALIPNNKPERSLKDPGWDLSVGEGSPGFVMYHKNGAEVTEYHRSAGLRSAEPLVLYREFHGIRPSYVELSEEFRLFHNLYFDAQNQRYLKLDDAGDEHEVVKVQGKRVEARLAPLRQFMAAKQMHLLHLFDLRASTLETLTEDEAEALKLDIATPDLRLTRHAGNYSVGDKRCFSRLLGKKLVRCGPVEDSGVWPYAEKSDFEEFIIGEDEQGRPVVHTCNPDVLANYFGANPGAPRYLTPVFFRKEVLGKYFNKPSLYSVEDGYLRCGSLWGCQIDNDNPNYVCVFLGDLGRDLPSSEQKYWRSFNIAPQGRISEANFRRSFLAEFCDPNSADLLFKSQFELFCKHWESAWQWPLFRPLNAQDEHLFATLRIPLGQEQSEFDAQILAIAKLLVDSLNVDQLKQRVTSAPDAKSLEILKSFSQHAKVPNCERHIEFLKALYGVRSAGVGHRKGENYQKALARLGVNPEDLPGSFRSILVRAREALQDLQQAKP